MRPVAVLLLVSVCMASLPELHASSISYTPDPLEYGSHVYMLVKIDNSGNASSGFYVSVLADGSCKAEKLVQGIGENSSTSVVFELDVNNIWRNICVRVDSSCSDSSRVNRVKEEDELNNELCISANFTLPNLVISSVRVEPDPPSACGWTRIIANISNLGGSMPYGSEAEVELGSGFSRYSSLVRSLRSGESVEVVWNVRNDGKFTIEVDPSRKVSESNENDNTAEIEIRYPLPDLVPNLSFSEEPENGKDVYMIINVSNLGKCTSKEFSAKVYVNGIYYSSRDIPGIEENGSVEFRAKWKVADGVIKVVVDEEDKVKELNEMNNVLVREIWISPPDLSVRIDAVYEPTHQIFVMVESNRKIDDEFSVEFRHGDDVIVERIDGIDKRRQLIFNLEEWNGYVTVTVDPDDEIGESNELNNADTLIIEPLENLSEAADTEMTYENQTNSISNETGMNETNGTGYKPENVSKARESEEGWLSLQLHSDRTKVEVGSEALFTISVTNPITNPNATVQVILLPPSGVSIFSSEFASSGAGQYTTAFNLPPGEVKHLSVRVIPNEEGYMVVMGDVVFSFGNESRRSSLSLPITAYTPRSPGFGFIIAAISILVAWASIRRI